MINDELKTIKTEFTELFKHDNLYQPIAVSIRKFINEIPTNLKWIAQTDHEQKAHFLTCLEDIEKRYLFKTQNYQRSINLIVTKNEAEIKKIQKQKTLKIDKLTKHFNQQFDRINKQREEIDNEYSAAIKDIEMTYQRDIGSFKKVAQVARKHNQKVTFEIENEQKEALIGLKSTFDKSTKTRADKRLSLITDYENRKKEIDERQTTNTTTNNDIYLAIKTNYNEFSVIFNKKINELNKQNQQALKVIKANYEAKKRPIDVQLSKLREDYKLAVDRVKASYQEDLMAMNVEFDEKRREYEDKKARIIHESNEMISLLNSKLTAYKESVNSESMIAAKEIRFQMKDTDDEHEQVDLQKTLRLNLKNANADLNKQIIRTNKEIAARQKDIHYRLYNHDLAYLKTINDWRLKKNLMSYQFKQSLVKIDLNFNHNIAQSKAQLALNENIYNHHEQLLNLSLNRDLLSLETQLQIASLIQDRELNLLTNDQQIAINMTKLEHAKLDMDHQLALEDLDFNQKQDELSYEYNQLTINSNTQLELEKARNVRDFSLQEQQIRSDIAKKIYEQRADELDFEKQSKLLTLNQEMKLLEMTQENDVFQIDVEHRLLAYKRATFIVQASLKNQKRTSFSNTKRLKSIDHLILLDQQYHVIQFEKYMMSLQQKRSHMRQIINDLYLLPSHPDIFKQSLLLAMRFDHEIHDLMQHYITKYATKIQHDFKQIIEAQDQYRHQMKHDEMMKFYLDKIKRISREQKITENDIQQIEHDYLKYQGDIDQKKAFIEQLIKINDQIKTGLLPLQTSYDYKENVSLIKNHQSVITHLNDNIKQADRMIAIKHREIDALAKQQTLIQKTLEISKQKCIKEKSSESQFYSRHLSRYISIYQSFSQNLQNYTESSQSFYADLKELVYVTNDALNNAFKKLSQQTEQFNKAMVSTEQNLLSEVLIYYQVKQNTLLHFDDLFIKTTKQYTHQILNSKEQFIQDRHHAQSIQLASLEKQRHIINRDLSNQKDILNISHERATFAHKQEIKQTEIDLDNHLAHSKAELHALNENQQAIALQYVKEMAQRIEGFNREHNKRLNAFKSNFTNISNDLNGNNDTLANKNQILLNRYDAQRSKALETMKNKAEHYDVQINHHHENIEKLKDELQNDMLMKMKKRQDDLKNIQNHMKQFESHATSEQKNVFNKEALALKKNLNFKLKALKLN